MAVSVDPPAHAGGAVAMTVGGVQARRSSPVTGSLAVAPLGALRSDGRGRWGGRHRSRAGRGSDWLRSASGSVLAVVTVASLAVARREAREADPD